MSFNKKTYKLYKYLSYTLFLDEAPISPTTSTSTKRHPSQSEEDIDKLVAMHQRHSSLGVSVL